MKAIPHELQEKITEAHSWMFPGDQLRVARISRLTPEHVSRSFKMSVYPSKRFLDAAITVMNENKAIAEVAPQMKVA